ncbi:glycoside hydrolase family 43 protein [Streptomyces sp. GC420]|uniref:glycoside hydrolase family 43 protein n=1 Tax=Streptomyces sp. GC420 TaxID=2697568 RepID=UPI0014151C6C|nr:glycoside hydrolase family 43 protein [Streptomyces sp. GC420]NBM15152.1 family 43 glycosylhydrolase [Streptomyces sp. GC420]
MEFFDNPVVPGFSPDPSVCRVGRDYYLATSSFEYAPGVPLWHSRDLMNWRRIGHALDRPSQLSFPDTLLSSEGVYAPTLRHHDGRFWLITTVVGGAGNILVTADSPEGPWSDPLPLALPGIDPDLAWDEDGVCWCLFSAASGIRAARIDPATGAVLGESVPVWSGSGLQYPEGPHLYRVGEWWYLLLSEGGTERGHALSVARARSPLGPYEPCPANPVLSHRSTDRPVQNTGHGDLIQAHDGSWWMVLLGTRPRGYTPQYHGLGRETFLTPVTWEDGWPLPRPVEERPPAGSLTPSPFPPEPARDDFDSVRLAPCWVSVRQHPATGARLDERPGHLVLHARGESLDRPGTVFVGRRQESPDCSARTLVDAGTGRAGLAVRLDEAHHYEVEYDAGTVRVRARIGPLATTVAERSLGPGNGHPGRITLRLDIRTTDVLPPMVTTVGQDFSGDALGARAGGPDTVVLGHETADGRFEALASLDGRYLTTEVAGGFTGRVIGMYVTRGSAAFDWFELTGS